MMESLSALNDAVQDTLEKLAYSEALPVETASGTLLAVPLYVTTVAVKRPYSGQIALMVPRDLAIDLIGSMLGCPDCMEEEWLQDGLSELVNTIGGRILAQLVDVHSSFDLGIPETVLVNKEPPRPSDVLVRQAYAVNGGRLLLELDFSLQA